MRNAECEDGWIRCVNNFRIYMCVFAILYTHAHTELAALNTHNASFTIRFYISVATDNVQN